MINKKDVLKTSLDIFIVAVGTLVMAFGNMAFLNPYNIVPGGFTGFAIILNKTIIPFLTPGVMSIILNVPLFLVAIKIKGKNFGGLGLAGMLFYSVFIDLIPLMGLNMESITGNNELLATVYGGIFMGVGYGLIVRRGGSTGGSDMVANLLNTVKPGMSFGTTLLFIDGFVVLLSGIAFSIQGGGIQYGVPAALYAFLVIFLSSRIADYIIEGKHSSRSYFIICSDPDAMTKEIFTQLKRGVTSLKAKGMYTNSEKEVLLCVVLRAQSAALKRIVFQTDPHAFVFSENITEVFGEGFMAPEIDKKKKLPHVKKDEGDINADK